MDTTIPVELQRYLRMADVKKIKDKGIDVTQKDFKITAHCRDAIDEAVVEAITKQAPL